MTIQFKKDVALTVITDFDESTDNIIGECEEIFKQNEIFYEVTLLSSTNGCCDIQFGDGSIAMGVQRNLFTIKKKE